MNRRTFLTGSLLASAGFYLQSGSLFAMTGFQSPWKINMIGETTGIFTEAGGAILFSFTKDGIVVVDSEFPPQATNLINELKKRNQQPFRLLINTHHHPDHSGGNISFKGIVQHVLAHSNSKINQQKQAVERKNEDKQLYPDKVFDTKHTETIGGEKISLHYFGAGHTNGDAIIHFERENIAHMGDLCFRNIVPNIDAAAGGSVRSWIETLNKTYALLDNKTRVICSHAMPMENVLVDREFLKKQVQFFEKVQDFVQKETRAGKSREEIIASTSVPGTEEWKDQWKFLTKNLAVAFDENR